MTDTLWRRFAAKLIEQTERGTMRWSVFYTTEDRNYCTCTVLDRLMCFWPDKGNFYVVATGHPRFYVQLSTGEIKSLAKAIGGQLSPTVEVYALAFAREYLGEKERE